MDRKLYWIGALIAGVAAIDSLNSWGSEKSQMPESRFGMPPQRESLSADPIAATAVSQDTDGLESSRGPASVVVSQDPPRDRKKIERVEVRRLESDEIPRLPEMDAIMSKRMGIQEQALIAGDLGYFPKTLFVTRDVPVRLFVTSSSKNALCIMMDSFQVRKQVKGNKVEEINFTPHQPGRYRFYCPVNGMEGTLIVRELASVEDK